MYAAARDLHTDHYRAQAEHALGIFERSGIAVFPSGGRRKGSYVGGWPDMSAGEAIATTRRDLAEKPINLAARTGDGTAVFDLDAKNGVEPAEMLPALLRLLGPATIAVVRTKRGFHIWARVAEPVGNGFCSFIGGEIFSGPHLAMLPPSIHPSGYQYSWEVEPRSAEAAANLKALGLVPDKPTPAKPRRAGGEDRPMTSATADTQQDFAGLMSEAGVWHVELPGLLATFDAPARAIRCACSIRERVRPLGVQIRTGLHTGECELIRDDVAGIAVHIAARVSAAATPGEVLVSSTVKDLVAGLRNSASPDWGMHGLKGVPDEWRLYAVQ